MTRHSPVPSVHMARKPSDERRITESLGSLVSLGLCRPKRSALDWSFSSAAILPDATHGSDFDMVPARVQRSVRRQIGG
jgi:hypothetical protein